MIFYFKPFFLRALMKPLKRLQNVLENSINGARRLASGLLEVMSEFDYKTYGFTLIALVLGFRIRVNTPPIMDEPAFTIVRETMNFPERLRYGRTFFMPMLAYYTPPKYRRLVTLTIFTLGVLSLIDAEERFWSNAIVPITITYMLLLFEDVYSSLFALAAYLYYKKGRRIRGSIALTFSFILKPVSPLAILPVILIDRLIKRDLKSIGSLAIPLATILAILYSASQAFSSTNRESTSLLEIIRSLNFSHILSLAAFSISVIPFTMYIGLTRRRRDWLLIRLSDLAINFYIYEFIYRHFYSRHFIIVSISAGVLASYNDNSVSLYDKLVAIALSTLYVYFYTLFYGLLEVVYSAFWASIWFLGIVGILLSKNLQQLLGAYTVAVGPLTAAILGSYRLYPYVIPYYSASRGVKNEKISG